MFCPCVTAAVRPRAPAGRRSFPGRSISPPHSRQFPHRLASWLRPPRLPDAAERLIKRHRSPAISMSTSGPAGVRRTLGRLRGLRCVFSLSGSGAENPISKRRNFQIAVLLFGIDQVIGERLHMGRFRELYEAPFVHIERHHRGREQACTLAGDHSAEE